MIQSLVSMRGWNDKMIGKIFSLVNIFRIYVCFDNYCKKSIFISLLYY